MGVERLRGKGDWMFYNSCCSGFPGYGYGYGYGYGGGSAFALIVVLFILLIIIGASWYRI